jgi:hypothetical protein
VLHYAAWGGHLEVVNFILRHVRSTHGEAALVQFVNCVDTVCHRATALMEACRSNIGVLSQRLECIHELIDAGADASAQDASGDNCLHIAVRNGFLPVVRYLTQHTQASALLASTAMNGRLEKPIDVAAAKCGLAPSSSSASSSSSSAASATSPNSPAPGGGVGGVGGAGASDLPHARLAIHKLLQDLLVTARLRLKVRALGSRRAERQTRLHELHQRDLAAVKAHIAGISERSWGTWSAQRAQAEQLRADERDMMRTAAKTQLATHFDEFLESPAGVAALAQQAARGTPKEEVRCARTRVLRGVRACVRACVLGGW